jgi:hypothetical protein
MKKQREKDGSWSDVENEKWRMELANLWKNRRMRGDKCRGKETKDEVAKDERIWVQDNSIKADEIGRIHHYMQEEIHHNQASHLVPNLRAEDGGDGKMRVIHNKEHARRHNNQRRH